MNPIRRALVGITFASALLAMLAVPLIAPNTGHAEDEESAVTLAGHGVVVLLAVAPGDKEYIEDITGQVRQIDEVGMLLDCTHRTLIDEGRRSSGEYQNQLFVPWSSVLYVKITS